MKYTVIGFFTCGCEYEASLMFDLVECKSLKEVEKIKKLMNIHSAEFQCHATKAFDIMVFPSAVMDGRKMTSFEEYVKLWKEEDVESKKMDEAMKNLESLRFDLNESK
jgi:hypothetical protein